jgi:alanyl-tRNA synthetase|eukprot:COSAG01_NODE_1436_length_10312_cov_12.469500_11_plen_77_part_00
MVSVPKPLTSKLKAGDVVKAVMPTLGGKGGGKPNFAQGQGSKEEAVDAAVTQATDLCKEKLVRLPCCPVRATTHTS